MLQTKAKNSNELTPNFRLRRFTTGRPRVHVLAPLLVLLANQVYGDGWIDCREAESEQMGGRVVEADDSTCKAEVERKLKCEKK